MKNKIFTVLLVIIFILELFSSIVKPVQAQGITDQMDIPLLQINPGEIQLAGPYGSSTQTFGLPVSWNLSPGAKLLLNMTVSFNSGAVAGQPAATTQAQGGTLSIRFNGVSVGILSLNQVGEVTQTVELPPSSLVSQRSDGRMELYFFLDSGASCYFNQQMLVIIHPNSILTLPHSFITPDVSLINFPRPLNIDSILTESAIVVVPDQPTAAELQAALTVSASLGSQTGTILALDIETVSTLSQEQQASNQLIIVGKSSSLSILKVLQLPYAVDSGQFLMEIGGEENGVIQLVNSPWNPGKVILLVSGNTDLGVIKAAQAISTGTLRPNTFPNLSIVQKVQSEQFFSSTAVDQSLNDLSQGANKAMAVMGKSIKTLKFGSSSSASYQFYIPPGQTVATEAYFDLIFGHSSLLNYARSGVAILINGQPVGTIRLSDVTAAKTTNHAQFTIPSTVIMPGYNRLEIRGSLVPNDACTNPNFDGLWVTIWPDSLLHIPLEPNQIATTSLMDLSSYPAPFVLAPTLSNTAFVLPHTDLDAWRSALRIANYLGNRTKSGLYTPVVFYADELKDPERSAYNLLVVGRPSQLPIITDLNNSLPAPFELSSDVAIEDNAQVQFSIPSNSPAGYIELLASPWNPNNLIIAALGNSTQGVSWAGSALVDAPLRTLLSGNFAVINGAQVISTDTRLTTFNIQTDLINNIVAPITHQNQINLLPPNTRRATWILPTILTTFLLSIVVIIMVIIFALKARNKASTTEEESISQQSGKENK